MHSPANLWEEVERTGAELSEMDRVNAAAHQRWRESWCAARFGMGYQRLFGYCAIEIEEKDEQRYYDFHLIHRDDSESEKTERKMPFQLVEVMDGHRRRQEYRNLTREQRLAAEAARGGTAEHAVERIKATLKGKVAKHYARADRMHFLLYVNVNGGAPRWKDLVEATKPESQAFGSVWLMTVSDFCCIHTNASVEARKWHLVTGWKPIDG